MSNGTDELTFRDPETFEIERTVAVTLDGEPIDYVNELECVGDQILANVWQTNSIIAIDSIDRRDRRIDRRVPARSRRVSETTTRPC